MKDDDSFLENDNMFRKSGDYSFSSLEQHEDSIIDGKNNRSRLENLNLVSPIPSTNNKSLLDNENY